MNGVRVTSRQYELIKIKKNVCVLQNRANNATETRTLHRFRKKQFLPRQPILSLDKIWRCWRLVANLNDKGNKSDREMERG